jgi:hypothetical protein
VKRGTAAGSFGYLDIYIFRPFLTVPENKKQKTIPVNYFLFSTNPALQCRKLENN